jgi:4-amino-4-deoxy-L-arabinose transferase-like glycosyltransferase
MPRKNFLINFVMHAREMKKYQTHSHVFIICILLFISLSTLFWFDTQSLIAHDEGLYARRARFLLESGDWFSPFFTPHHKTVGSYWPIATSFKLFGASDWAARVPSVLSAIIATILFYFVSCRYFNSLRSFVASLALLATPIYFQASRTAGPDMLFVLIIIAQVYFFVSINKASGLSDYLKMIGLGICISLAFFVRSFAAFIPIISLLPLIISRCCFRSITFWAWTSLGILLGSFPLLMNLYAVFIDHGNAGLLSLFSFASRKFSATEFGLILSIPFYFSRFLLFTFPVFFIIFSSAKSKSSKKPLLSSILPSLKSEINSLAVLFPLIYLSILSFMGTRHYHYLTPLVPFFVLNIARIDLSSRGRQFNFEAYLIGFMGLLYSIGACLILLVRPEDMMPVSVYFAFAVLLFCSALCIYTFILKIFLLRVVAPFALLIVIFVSQYLSLSALAGGGVIWSTNKDLKSLARSINAECGSSGVYLYGLSGKDVTVLRFYLDKPHVLVELEDPRSLPKKCLVVPSSAKENFSEALLHDSFSKTYFR